MRHYMVWWEVTFVRFLNVSSAYMRGQLVFCQWLKATMLSLWSATSRGTCEHETQAAAC